MSIQFKWNPFFESLKPMISDTIDGDPSEGMKLVHVGALFWVSLLNNC